MDDDRLGKGGRNVGYYGIACVGYGVKKEAGRERWLDGRRMVAGSLGA
jgi:hypothetical protein